MPYCTVVRAIYILPCGCTNYYTLSAISPCTCVLSYKPVNTPQAGLYEYNALVRNHTRALYSIQPSLGCINYNLTAVTIRGRLLLFCAQAT